MGDKSGEKSILISLVISFLILIHPQQTDKRVVRSMAKKKTSRKKAVTASTKSAENVQFALRLKPELYERLKEVAGEASTSVNQLVQDICEAAMANVRIGEATKTDDNFVIVRPEEGRVTFGDFRDTMYSYQNGPPMDEDELHMKPVSYTHLTLPTKRIV